MIRVRTGSRLHFGLLSLDGPEPWSNHLGEPALPGRRFGGVGLMVQKPGLIVEAESATAWSADGPLAERALAFAREGFQNLPSVPPRAVRPCRLVVRESAPEHVGLGTGTQLALAVGKAVAATNGWSDADLRDLALRMGRGKRSALGFCGFAHGGFLVEGGKRDAHTIAPLIARWDFPGSWRLLLVLPPRETGVHGEREIEAFERLQAQQPPPAWTDRLCRLVLLGLLPALIESDCKTFGEALFDFNSRVGEAFAPVQGGVYASPRVAELVKFIRQEGVPGAGQSSWGPTVFAVTETEDRATALAQAVRNHFNLEQADVIVTSACNHGAVVELGLSPT
jgi:beta-RFAP synthase